MPYVLVEGILGGGGGGINISQDVTCDYSTNSSSISSSPRHGVTRSTQQGKQQPYHVAVSGLKGNTIVLFLYK